MKVASEGVRKRTSTTTIVRATESSPSLSVRTGGGVELVTAAGAVAAAAAGTTAAAAGVAAGEGAAVATAGSCRLGGRPSTPS